VDDSAVVVTAAEAPLSDFDADADADADDEPGNPPGVSAAPEMVAAGPDPAD